MNCILKPHFKTLTDLCSPREKSQSISKLAGYFISVTFFLLGLLWTAPEFLSPQVKSIDNVKDKTAQGDAYSFGIILAEILSRRPPFGEISVMPIAHIVQAVGHMREVVQDLGTINLPSKSTNRKMSSSTDKEGMVLYIQTISHCSTFRV